MKILFVASEASPFAASGGLGDVMGALPPVIASEEGVECEVILPLYRSVKDEFRKDFKHVCDISFSLSWRKTGATVYRCDRKGVAYYFVENHYYFDRDRLYGEMDDGERFAFFSLAVLEFLKAREEAVPDILHANDWQTALSVIYLKTELSHIKRLSSIRTVFTIHNIEYQGKFDPYILGDIFSLDSKYYSIVEWDGCINLMKGALQVSDFVSTVSANYACELEQEFFSFGLSPMIKGISDKFVGILNGIDYEAFSPENGLDIYKSYSSKDRKKGKAYNKRELQREIGLPAKDVPMIAMITRLTEGKGVDLVLHVLDDIMKREVQFVLLGTGDKKYEEAFAALGERYDSFVPLLRFDRSLSKKIYAAADLFLMPSKSEPCGLAQMIACSYGTLPIVRAVGGLADSIKNGQNGFVFDQFNAHDMLSVIESALDMYGTDAFARLARRAKSSDFTWERSAEKYIQMYENLLKQ